MGIQDYLNKYVIDPEFRLLIGTAIIIVIMFISVIIFLLVNPNDTYAARCESCLNQTVIVGDTLVDCSKTNSSDCVFVRLKCEYDCKDAMNGRYFSGVYV